MANAELAQRYASTMRHDTIVPGMVREVGRCTVRYTQRQGSVRFVLWHRLAAADVEGVVAEEVALARGQVQALIWRVHADDEPRELGAHLRAVGFRHEDTTLQHFARPQRVLDATRDHGCPFEIRELTTARELDAYLPIWNEAWPNEPNARYVGDYQRLINDGDAGMRFWAAFDGGQAMASAYLAHPPGFDMALLHGGVTRRAWQRRGAYRALLHARALAADAAGVRTLCVDASAQAAPVLQQLGFEPQVEVDFYELDFTPP
jgi:GNAT superfamily N-acetyltransferase